ncbi:MAG: hypothetical protein IKY46_00585, partial [Clostridia bacterium]|nr:hypothetical protein [Clostridia bacterium]
KNQCEELSLQKAALISQKDELSDALQKSEEQRMALEAELERRSADTDALKTALAAVTDECKELRAEYEKSVSQSGKSVAALESANRELAKQLEQSRELAAGTERENARLKQQISMFQLKNKLKTDPVRTILSYVRKK